MISNISGTRLHSCTLRTWWEDEHGSFGLEGVTFHELCHTLIAMLALGESTRASRRS